MRRSICTFILLKPKACYSIKIPKSSDISYLSVWIFVAFLDGFQQLVASKPPLKQIKIYGRFPLNISQVQSNQYLIFQYFLVTRLSRNPIEESSLLYLTFSRFKAKHHRPVQKGYVLTIRQISELVENILKAFIDETKFLR